MAYVDIGALRRPRPGTFYLTDADTTTTPPLGSDVLTFNSGTGNWEPEAPSGGVIEYVAIAKLALVHMIDLLVRLGDEFALAEIEEPRIVADDEADGLEIDEEPG